MQLSQQAGVTLTTLNEDCLLLICAQLAISDQFALLQLGGRLRQLVLRLWRGKYANAFDWQREVQVECLSASEQSQLLAHIGGMTRALLNLSMSGKQEEGEQLKWKLKLRRKRKRKCMSMPNMQRLSFGARCKLTSLLRQLPQLWPNLVQLQLGAFVGVTPADICLLHAQLPQLSCFELLPANGSSKSICGAPTAALADIPYGRTLQTLRIPACALRAASAEIARLPQLRQLTGFLCCAGDIDADKEQANAGALATATISACLAALSIVGVGSKAGGSNEVAPPGGTGGVCGAAYQIVSLRLQCQLDGSLPRLLASHSSLVRLQRFAWHSLLVVHSDATDGSIKWLPQASQVPRAWQRFIVSQTDSLRELDLMRNVHATPTFLTQLTQQLGDRVAVWHNGRPRDRMRTEQTDMDSSRDDLAFVELQLKRLANERANSTMGL